MKKDAMKIVLTGGPHSGKTTLIDYLKEKGFQTIPEASKILIKEMDEKMGLERQLEWRRKNKALFQNQILDVQEELEKKAPQKGVVFFDRGVIDSLAYCRVYKISPIPEKLFQLIEKYHYDHVFILDTILPYNRTGRTTSPAFSLQVKEELEKAYREYGYEPAPIPQLPLEERARKVLQLVKKNQ